MSNNFESLMVNARQIDKDLTALKARFEALEQQVSPSPFDVIEILLRLRRIEEKLGLEDPD